MIEKIKEAIEKKAMQTGAMGTENVSILLKITEAERLEFLEESDQLDEHWHWDIDDGELHVIYTETLPKYVAQKKYLAKLKQIPLKIPIEKFDAYRDACEKNGTKPVTELRSFINNYIEGVGKMNGYELLQKLEDLSAEEVKKGTKATEIAYDIFNVYYSHGEGDEVITELLSNNFVYDYKDFKVTSYFDDCQEVSNFGEQGLLIKQAEDYINWADQMKTILQ
ncbi:MAG: hypothetical protein CVU92_09560 [Firmicutes bacterium HGW-Firmicutes-17]|jgi:hypothetical protein|nr:MAG: hypothetical protein CVU92_09560 [Firmicutes bacterium HGW-Firmicutes-17]